ncbi:MAG: hypothetical protein Q8922_10420 [Bacteroidota bacterium]|nr:hypothetical protein [Bacteroidota bacterium]MDP4234584.1 hypothetical protein [Bacteroidota bacterium]MDP4243713.1 hypothetical protein [Bacteroidota bacterium]MDP4288339.1 hypothetical protein [Bacteroidota bacterium]
MNTQADSDDRTGIERAFDVIRHHTVHTRGYVLTALKLIDEFGTEEDKALLSDLLRNGPPAPPLPPANSRSKKQKATQAS